MSLFAIPLLATLLTIVGALVPLSMAPRDGVSVGASSTITRFVSSSSSSSDAMPYSEDEMPFYALGTNLGRQVGNTNNLNDILEADELDIVLEAVCATVRGTATQDARTILTTYGPQLNHILQERTSRMLDRTKQEGLDFVRNFLVSNPAATQTDSGLVYLETKRGTGERPNVMSTVEVNYHGTLLDGTIFDSSRVRGDTATFPVSGVIKVRGHVL